MGIFRKPVFSGSSPAPSRAPLRTLLRRAAKGETGAYLALVRPYFDLISEHLYLCNYDRAATLHEAEFLLHEGWKRLPYLKRLSDWEHFLARNLTTIEVNASYSRETGRPQALVELERQSKFALIAFDLENWGYRWLSLALRVEPRELRNILFETRCILLGIDLSRTKPGLRRCLALISAGLDGQLTHKQQRQALRQVCTCEQTKDFKSRWLDFRCHLIEKRQQIRLPEAERDLFLERLSQHLFPEEMLRPSLLARFRNLVSFRELPPRRIIPGRGDFSYGDG